MQAGFILHQYVFVEPLGEGGMAEVWKGRHTQLDYEIAIKFLKPQFAHDRDLQERFLNEGRRQANLDHPNIVRAIDFVSDGDRHFLIMKYVEGGGLDRRIAEAHGPLSVEESLNVSVQVLSALAHAHRQGVIHRDVKPSNVLVNREGHCYLTDFGIALAVGQQRFTRTGTVMGTDYYMSPEQIRSPHRVDHRTDIYAFGAVLFEMLTGVVPFDRDNEFLLKQAHVEEEPPKPSKLNPAISKAIESVVLRALEKKPEDRWSDCDAMIAALEAAGNGPRPPSRKRRSQAAPEPVSPKPRTDPGASASLDPVEPKTKTHHDTNWFAGKRKAVVTLSAGIMLVILAGLGVARYVRSNAHKTASVPKPVKTITGSDRKPPLPVARPIAINFTAEPLAIRQGASADLVWSVGDATTVTIDQGIGTVKTTDRIKVSPTTETTYTLKAEGPGGATAQATVTVLIEAPIPKPVIVFLRASPLVVRKGQPATISWEVTGENPLVSFDQGIGKVKSKDSFTFTGQVTTTFKLLARNSGGSASKPVTVEVQAPDPPQIAGFHAEPTSIKSGQKSTLSWSVHGETDSVSISPGVGQVPAEGSHVVSPIATTTYTISAAGPGGPITQEATVRVAMPPAPVIRSFSVTPEIAALGDSVVLSWRVEGDDVSVTLEPGGVKLKQAGSRKEIVKNTTRFTLTASTPGGTVSSFAGVEVSNQPLRLEQFALASPKIHRGESTTLTWRFSGPVTAVTITAQATNSKIPQPVSETAGSAGSVDVKPDHDTVYTIVAHAGGKSTLPASIKISVKK